MISYTINYKNKLLIFGNYPEAALFVAERPDENIEITRWSY